MKEEFKKFVGIAIFLMVFWGIMGLIQGKGFWGSINMEINAIGYAVSLAIKIALFAGVAWLIVDYFKSDK